jgi:hypothetical protein
MTMTKAYLARNRPARDRVIESMSLVAGIIAVALVLLFFAGALDFGPGIKITQSAVQSSASSVDK